MPPCMLRVEDRPRGLLHLSGDLVRERRLTLGELRALGPLTIPWLEREGRHDLLGVRLDLVLRSAGWTDGPVAHDAPAAERFQGLRAALVATSADGLEAVFSLAELLPSRGPTLALLAWSMDGAPLPESQGPLRLAVPTDNRFARSLTQVVSLRVVSLSPRRG